MSREKGQWTDRGPLVLCPVCKRLCKPSGFGAHLWNRHGRSRAAFDDPSATQDPAGAVIPDQPWHTHGSGNAELDYAFPNDGSCSICGLTATPDQPGDTRA